MDIDKEDFNFQKGVEEFRLKHNLPAIYPKARELAQKEHPFWFKTKNDKTYVETLNEDDRMKYLKIFGENTP